MVHKILEFDVAFHLQTLSQYSGLLDILLGILQRERLGFHNAQLLPVILLDEQSQDKCNYERADICPDVNPTDDRGLHPDLREARLGARVTLRYIVHARHAHIDCVALGFWALLARGVAEHVIAARVAHVAGQVPRPLAGLAELAIKDSIILENHLRFMRLIP